MSKSSRKKREELRRKRLEAEERSRAGERRQTMVKAMTATVLVAVLAVVGLFVAMTSGGQDAEPSKNAAEIDRLFAGVPQNGTVLGDPKAPLTIIEFGDLRCGFCKAFSETELPALIRGPVRAGTVRLEYRNLPVTGTDSITAARASLAASEQGRYWQYIETFYAEFDEAGGGSTTDEFLREVAEKAGVRDLDRWEQDRLDPRWDQEINRNEQLASELGPIETPTFALEDSKGKLTVIEDGTSEGIEAAISKATSRNAG